MTNRLEEFLRERSADSVDGMIRLSPDRPFQHQELDYDEQYANDAIPPGVLRSERDAVLAFWRELRLDPGACVVEIGCGSGRLSVHLAVIPEIDHLLVTDPSPAFLRITRRKLAARVQDRPRISHGVMQAEDVGLLPAGSVRAVVMRSVLHHVLDVDAFLRDCAHVLPAGGVLVCEEPCYEGYMLMGMLAQFIPLALERAGHPVSEEDRRHVSNFVATMQFYCRRDVDKSAAEDKHLFRPDELTLAARAVGLELTHLPNWRLTATAEQNLRARIGHFRRFLIDYLRYCMSWPADLCLRTDESLREYLAFFDPIETRKTVGAQCFGTFIFRRL